jgi:hypothetical protein
MLAAALAGGFMLMLAGSIAMPVTIALAAASPWVAVWAARAATTPGPRLSAMPVVIAAYVCSCAVALLPLAGFRFVDGDALGPAAVIGMPTGIALSAIIGAFWPHRGDDAAVR